MGKTYRNLPRTAFRNPKGRKQALVAGVRPGAVPPDAWDDVNFSLDTKPYGVARRMVAKNVAVDDITYRLIRKFHLSHKDASRIAHNAVKLAA